MYLLKNFYIDILKLLINLIFKDNLYMIMVDYIFLYYNVYNDLYNYNIVDILLFFILLFLLEVFNMKVIEFL